MKNRSIKREYTLEPSFIDGKKVFSPVYEPLENTKPKTIQPSKPKKRKQKHGRRPRKRNSTPYIITDSGCHMNFKG